MKRLLFSVIITLLCLSASAEDNTVKIGYCNGEMATSTEIELTGERAG
jgi:Skp family chaperone for outer membrane proteins